jgi:4-oxalocrotonate tautomerase
MPLVQVKLVENALSSAEKERLIAGLTDATAAVVGQDVRPYIWVLVDELSSGDWGIGGSPITTEAVRTMRGVS